MQPVLAVYAGYSLAQEHVNPGPDLEPYVQDALDEIEYVTGGPDTKWGAERAKNGHPAPFKLTYVEIGNEDWFDRSGSYDGRYTQFYKAIKAKYPDLQLIATTPVKSVKPDVHGRSLLRPRHAELPRRQSLRHARQQLDCIEAGTRPLRQGRPQRTEDLRRRMGHARRRSHAQHGRRARAMPPG